MRRNLLTRRAFGCPGCSKRETSERSSGALATPHDQRDHRWSYRQRHRTDYRRYTDRNGNPNGISRCIGGCSAIVLSKSQTLTSFFRSGRKRKAGKFYYVPVLGLRKFDSPSHVLVPGAKDPEALGLQIFRGKRGSWPMRRWGRGRAMAKTGKFAWLVSQTGREGARTCLSHICTHPWG